MNKQPLLIINMELNLPHRPQLIIYKDTNIDNLIEHFVLQHDLKPTAIHVIRQLIYDNLKTKAPTKTNHKNYSQWKSHHEREKSKENNKPIKHKVAKKESPRPSLLEMSFQEQSNRSVKKAKEVSTGEVQKEFQRQFQRIKLQRVVAKQEQSLRRIYEKLTRQNPEGVKCISPEHIDFSSFSADFLTILQQFFEVLKQQDFIQLDFEKFKRLIEKYHYRDLFKMQRKF